jgi:phosphoglycolate phosphatase
MKPINLLIFDLDGTLVDTLDDITASVNYTLDRLGKGRLTRDRVRQMVGDGIEVLLARALAEPRAPEQAVTLYKAHHHAHLTVHSRLYPGVREMLEHFSAIPLVVISNKTSEFVVPVLERLGIARYFAAALGADAGLPLKPAPDLILRVLSQFAVPKEAAAIIGDGTTDMRAGKAAGIVTCAVTYGFRTEAELRQIGPDHVISSLEDLKTIFLPVPAVRSGRT